MTLDPTTDALCAMLAAKGGRAIHEAPVAEGRQMMRMLVELLQGEVPAVERVWERRIPGPGGELPLRIYSPAPADEPRGVLVTFHGGGWVLGDLETHDVLCRHLCLGAEVVVVSVDYRRAPEHPFPAGHDDALAATLWASEHAAELGADPARLAVGGDSAGGNLAAVVAQRARGKVAYQQLIYPATDLSEAVYPSREAFGGGEYLLALEDMKWFVQQLSPDREALTAPEASPMAGDLAGVAPAFVLTAGYDPLRDEGQAYAAALEAAGVETEYRCFAGTVHGFVSFTGALEAAREAVPLLAERLKAAIG